MDLMALLTSFHLIPNTTRFGAQNKEEIVVFKFCDVISSSCKPGQWYEIEL